MKKVALSLLALAVVGTGAFADAPKWDPKVSTEFKGAASVTLGYDLDTGISAFSNDTSVTLIIDLVSGGDKATTSDQDVWGEIKIKTDGDPVRIKADDKDSDATTAYDNGFKLQVDFATIHFGKAAYLKITSKDTQVGYANSPDLAFVGHAFSHWALGKSAETKTLYSATGAETVEDGVTYVDLAGDEVLATALTAGDIVYKVVAADDTATATRYGTDNGVLHSAYGAKGPTAGGGAEFGYSLEKVASIALVVGSVDAWSTDLVNNGSKTNIAYKAVLGLLAVDNLTAEAAYSSSTIKNTATALGGKVSYKYAIDGDKLYVKPSVGVTQYTAAGEDSKAVTYASAGLLIGTGAKAAAFDNYGLKLDSDYGSYPGVAVGVFYDDADKVAEDSDKTRLGLNVSANSGAAIENVTLVAAYDVIDLNAEDVESNITVGFATSFKTGDVTIAPKGFISSLSSKEGVAFYEDGAVTQGDSSLFAKVTTDITGVIPFVTFTINYESNDLVNGYGVDNDKTGKLELTTKVSF